MSGRAAKYNYPINQGETSVETFNWYAGGKVCKTIEGVTEGCPTQITVTSHGLPTASDTPIFIEGVRGARSLNTNGASVLATYIDGDNFFVDLNSQGDTWESGTGVIIYYAPKDLTGWTARMQIREDVDDAAFIAEVTTTPNANGDVITISTNDAGISVKFSETTTAGFTFDTAVYDLELVDPSSEVTRLIEGEIELNKEVTR